MFLLITLQTCKRQINWHLNIKKSNPLVFDSRKKSKEKPPVKPFINDEELEQKDFAKYVGVYFSIKIFMA